MQQKNLPCKGQTRAVDKTLKHADFVTSLGPAETAGTSFRMRFLVNTVLQPEKMNGAKVRSEHPFTLRRITSTDQQTSTARPNSAGKKQSVDRHLWNKRVYNL